MSVLALYLVLLKATITSFSGFGSLPQVREDLVVRRQIVSDDALSKSVLVARTTPGPMGLYVVSIGYEAAGVPGAVAGWLAMASPALIVIPVSRVVARGLRYRRARSAISSLVLASALLIVQAGIPLAAAVVGQWAHVLGW